MSPWVTAAGKRPAHVPVEVGNGELHPAVAGRVDHALGDEAVAEGGHLRRCLARRGGDVTRSVRAAAERRQGLDIGNLRCRNAGDPRRKERRVECVVGVRRSPGYVGRRDRIIGCGVPGVVGPRLDEEGESVGVINDALGCLRRPGDADLACRLDDCLHHLIRSQRAQIGDGEHPFGVCGCFGNLADEVGEAGEQTVEREAILATSMDAGEQPTQIVTVEGLGFIQGNHHAKILVGYHGGEVGDDVGQGLAVGIRCLTFDRNPRAGDGERDRLDRAQRPADLGSTVELLHDAPSLAKNAANGVVTPERFNSDDPIPDVLGHRRQLAEQHRLAHPA